MTGFRWVICLATVAGFAGCATAGETSDDPDVRLADDAPTSFVSEDGSPLGEDCRNTLIDPRDQTRLRLQRAGAQASTSHGDYMVPTVGKYGVRDRELLRVNCETGQVIGIVPS